MVLVKVAVKGDDVVSLHSRLLESCSGVLFLLGEHFAPGGANMEEDYYAYFVRVVKTFFILSSTYFSLMHSMMRSIPISITASSSEEQKLLLS